MIFISSRLSTLLDFYENERQNELTPQKSAELYSRMKNPLKKFMTQQQISNEINQLRLIGKFLTGKIDKLSYKNFPNLKIIAEKISSTTNIKTIATGKFQDFQISEYAPVYSEVPMSRLTVLLKAFDDEINGSLSLSNAKEIYGKIENPNGILNTETEINEGAKILIAICKFLSGKIDAFTCQFIPD